MVFVFVCWARQGLDLSQLTGLASAYAMTSNVFFAIRGILSKKVSNSVDDNGDTTKD